QKDMGCVMSPFDAWLLIRGLKTLPLRMDRHSDNAEKIFEKLNKHPKIKSVYYPGDRSHPDYSIKQKQMKRGGGLISFEIEGSKRDAQDFLKNYHLLNLPSV